MTHKEFEMIVSKYDPDIGDLLEWIIENQSVEIASASLELFAGLSEDL
jgi:hypothetical protein